MTQEHHRQGGNWGNGRKKITSEKFVAQKIVVTF